MNLNTLALILLSVGLSSVAQVTMKRGVSADAVQDSISDPLRAILAFAASGNVIAGLVMYGVGAVIWLFVLSRLDVSMAYPFVALGFLITMVLAALFIPLPWSLVAVAVVGGLATRSLMKRGTPQSKAAA